MSWKITSDSTCDLSSELLEKYDIDLAPLHVQVGDESCLDGVDVDPDKIYAHVSAGGNLPKTQAVNVAEYAALFGKYAGERDFVIHVTISSDFSSCYQNACLAAQDFDNVYVVDSRNLSSGHGHVVIEAARLAAEGLAPAEIVEKLNDYARRVDASFILERLDYMAKGGRCSTVEMLGANLLKLRPGIEVRNGKMEVGKKYRGRFDICLKNYITDRLNAADDLDLRLAFVTHSGGVTPEMEADAVALVKQLRPFEEVLVTHAGCTVCSHCGPSTIGVLFAHKAKDEA